MQHCSEGSSVHISLSFLASISSTASEAAVLGQAKVIHTKSYKDLEKPAQRNQSTDFWEISTTMNILAS